jgi:Uma2 family endonuclease
MTTTFEAPSIRPLMTTEELLALPEDGMERELIRGQLKEREMTRRNPTHSSVEACTAKIFGIWSDSRPKPRGLVLSGEAGFRICRDPDTTVGIDVAYIDAETAARIPKNAGLIDAPPLLAVEIMSPSDKQEDILDKVRDYLEAGTKLVLLLEPVFETITVFRPDAKPVLLSGDDELIGDPHLPGFRCAAKQFFGG